MKQFADLVHSAWVSLRQSYSPPSRHRTRRFAARRFHAAIAAEVLEDRTLLSTLTVNSLGDDTTSGDGLVTLREAIFAANSDSATDLGEMGSGADTIVFDAGLSGGTIALSGLQLPTISSELTITGLGAGQLTIDAGGNSQIFVIGSGIDVTISGLTLTGGDGSTGGAISNQGSSSRLTLVDSVVTGNSASQGGGVYTANNSELTVVRSTFSANTATNSGAGIFNFISGTIDVIDSTFSGNSATLSGGAITNTATGSVTGSTFNGNSADIAGAIDNLSTMTIVNSTISGNTARGDGGGIRNFSTLTVTNSTIVLNRADSDGNASGSGGGVTSSGTTTLNNTIVAGNVSGAAGSDTANDVSGGVSGSNNLIGDAASSGGLSDGVDGNIVGNNGVGVIDLTTVFVDENSNSIIDVGDLADNGGPTETHALITDGPTTNLAIDAGNDGLVPAGITTDQRGTGFNRFAGPVDIGAFEAQILPSISGTVFVDINQNGLFEANEMGIDGVTIELLDGSDNLIATTVTSDGGFYLFTDLVSGTYRIREIQPTGVSDGAEILGSLGGSIISNDVMELVLASLDGADYDFAEIGQQLTSGDTASIGFWQNKHGQSLISQGGTALAQWLTANFSNVFGNTLENASGDDVAAFYKDQLFKQKGKKSAAGPAKVDAQFMAVAFATFFTSRNLAGEVAADFGFNVTDTGIGTNVVNVGANGAAFNVNDNTDMTIMQLLVATDSLTDTPDDDEDFAFVYDANGDGVIDAAEESLRVMANELYSSINES